MNITPNELEVINAINDSEYGDLITDEIWTWSIADNVKTLKGKEISVTVSSLLKKDLVHSYGWGEEAVVYLTEAGAALVTSEKKKPTAAEAKAYWASKGEG